MAKTVPCHALWTVRHADTLMGVPLVRRDGWAQIVHLVTTTAFFSFKALCYENTNQKKTFETFWSWKFSFIYFFHFKYISKELLSFFKSCLYSYGENCRYPCSLHCTNQTCDRLNGSCLTGYADRFYGKFCDRGNACWKT